MSLVNELIKGLLPEEKKYIYIGTCMNSFDDYGECKHNAFYDEEHFFNSWAAADEISKEEFWSNIDPSSDKYQEVKKFEADPRYTPEYAYSKEDDIYYIFINDDTHYFFVNPDTLREYRSTPEIEEKIKLENNLSEQGEKKQTTAVYAGGFKPPTSGHFKVVKQALKENPEIDKLIILIGGKERDGISPDESLLIWDIYKTYLPFKVEIEYSSKPPIRAVYNYAKEHPDKEVLFILGAREGNEDDFKDIASRTTSLDKYPNLNLRTIVTQGGVSGTAARNAAKISLDKFKRFVPSELSDEEVEEVYNIISNKVTEGRKKKQDPKKGTGKKPKGSDRRLYTDEDPKDTVGIKFSTRQDIVDTLNKKSFKAKSHARQSQIINLIHQRVRAAYNRAKDPAVKKRLKTALDYAEERKEASKAKTQRLKKKKIKENNDILESQYGIPPSKLINLWKKETTDSELKYFCKRDNCGPAAIDFGNWAQSLGIKLKRVNGFFHADKVVSGKRDFTDQMKQEFLDQGGDFDNAKEREEWVANSKYSDQWKFIPHYWLEDNKGTVYDPVGQEQFIDAGYAKDLNPNRYSLTDDVNEELKAKQKTNEAIDSSKFDFRPYIASLTKHMLDNGLKLEPLPQIQLIHDDYENGEDLFGNTAYYNPGNNSVILFTYGRHPKDILRSYAHELVHVHQNMEDRLTGLGANTDVNQDDHLEQIEREAYETGNIMFRSWTDSITGNKLEESVKALITEKKKKDPFGLLAYAQELGRLREDDVKKSPFSKEIQYWIDEDIKDYGDMLEFKIDLTDTYQYSFNSNLGEFYDDVNGVKIVVKLKPTSRNIPEFKFYSLQDGKQLSFSRLKHYNPKVMNTIFKIFMDEILPKNKKILIQPLDYTRYRLFRAMLNNNLDGRIYKVDTKDNPLEQSILLIQKIKSDTPLREKEESWKVYLDMDGVLADFDQRFKDISGMEPKEFEDKYGTKAFWNLIDEENKISFWVGIPEMPGAKALVDAVKDYNFELLTSPSAKKQSYLGKILWVRNHSDLFGGKPRINFKKAKEKHLVKPELSKTDILIDDREDTIERWNAAGGTGIVYKNISQVLNDLGKLGL